MSVLFELTEVFKKQLRNFVTQLHSNLHFRSLIRCVKNRDGLVLAGLCVFVCDRETITDAIRSTESKIISSITGYANTEVYHILLNELF